MNLSRIIHPGPTPNHTPLPASGRAGRNLPAAVGVGVGLGGIAVAALLLSRVATMVLIAVLVLVALWELAGAFARVGREVVLIPAWIGAIGMLVCAGTLGLEATLAALCFTAATVVLWKLLERPAGSILPAVVTTVFALIYVAFLASFVVFMLGLDAGARAVIVYLLMPVANDTGGWMVGIVFGKHPMAPRISPKKSWEGFAGSLGLSLIVGVAGMMWLGAAWWWGLILACATTVAATVGDLVESLIKRDVGLKDMSNLLPGHGGVMDRMDSLLMVAPVAYLIFTAAGR